MAKVTKAQTALLAAIVAATQAGNFTYQNPGADKDVVALNKAGLVEFNDTISDGQGGVATRATQAGVYEIHPELKPAFVIENDIAITPSKRNTLSRPEAFPFSQLEVGQSFFVPATAERPEPEKTFGSTVSSASARYSFDIPGEFKNRKDKKTGEIKQIPVKGYERKFEMRPAEKDGVKGVRVWRVAVDSTSNA